MFFTMEYNVKKLEARAQRLRKEVFDFAKETGLKHFGGSFSCIELLVALHRAVMQPDDRFILSKGHAAPPLYVLLREQGYTPAISGHPDLDLANGIHATTGSLGHGLPAGIGIAFARKLMDKPGHTYVLMSDGECQEGTTWESLLHGARLGLDNLTAIIDYNKIQSSDRIEHIVPIEPLADKFRAFNWEVGEVNGHAFEEIIPRLNHRGSGTPYIVIAHTVKGKGVSFMQDSAAWHSEAPTGTQWEQAYREVSGDAR